MEIYSENSKFYIREKRGYSGKKHFRRWVEWFTPKGFWSEQKVDAAEFATQEEAERAAPRVVKRLGDDLADGKLKKILDLIDNDESGDLEFIKYQIKKILDNNT